MVDVDSHFIHFRSPRCGFELERTIGLLKAGRRIVCTDGKVGINIDGARFVAAAEALNAAVLPGADEITIKFFR